MIERLKRIASRVAGVIGGLCFLPFLFAWWLLIASGGPLQRFYGWQHRRAMRRQGWES